MEGCREERQKSSTWEHGAEDALEIAIDVGSVGYRQLVTGGIPFF
jgi:hypothetical protein